MNALSPTIGLDVAEAPLARHIRTAQERVEFERSHHGKEAARHRSVNFGGMAPEPFVEPSPGRLIAAAEASLARENEIKASSAFKASRAAIALRKTVESALLMQATRIERACSRDDGSAIKEIDEFRALLDELKLSAADAWNLAWDAECDANARREVVS